MQIIKNKNKIKENNVCIDAMLWVGKTYPTVDAFVKEAQLRGCCRKLPFVYSCMKFGKTKIFLAHGDGHKNPKRGSIFGYFVLHRIEIITEDEVVKKLYNRDIDSLWPSNIQEYIESIKKWEDENGSQEEIGRRLKKKMEHDHLPKIAKGKTQKKPTPRPGGDKYIKLIEEILKKLLEEWLDRGGGSGCTDQFPPKYSVRGEGHRSCSIRKGVPGMVYVIDALCAAVHNNYQQSLQNLLDRRTKEEKEDILNEFKKDNKNLWDEFKKYRRRHPSWSVEKLLEHYKGPFHDAIKEIYRDWKLKYPIDPRLKGKAKSYGELVVFNKPYPILEKAPRAAFKGIWRIDGDKLINQIAEYTGKKALIPTIYTCRDTGRARESSYLLRLDLKYKQYLKTDNVDEQLRNAFKDEKFSLSSSAKISKIDKRNWRITDGIMSYEIEGTDKQLNIYKPQEIRTKEELIIWLAEELYISRACATRFLDKISLKAREQLKLYEKFKLPGIGTIRLQGKETPKKIKFIHSKAKQFLEILDLE